ETTLPGFEKGFEPFGSPKKKLKKITANNLAEYSSELDLNKANRGINWLKEKNIVTVETEKHDSFTISELGKNQLIDGLPEERLLIFLNTINKPIKIQNLNSESGLNPNEFRAAFGILKNKNLLSIKNGYVTITTDEGKNLNYFEDKEEKKILNDLANKKAAIQELKHLDKINVLKKRGLIDKITATIITGRLTPLGEKLIQKLSEEGDYYDQLTREDIISGEWKNKKLRPYRVETPIPPYLPGKRHFYWQVVDYVRQVWLSLGFQEMEGTIVQTSFWNFDALFVPQDHTAREAQDTFFIKNPPKGKVDNEIYEDVAGVHQNGKIANSKGWGGQFKKEISETLSLRPHTTCLSAQTIKTLRKKGYPAKYFAVGRCFRNEKIDWKHLAEFDQVEGIVVDPDVTFQDLLGYLQAFYLSLGYKDIRFRPGFYPYTEPSVGIEILHPIKKEWIEVGGSGVFRPEVVIPLLGEDVPVLAWGPGIGRMISERYSKFLVDIRSQYENYIDHLRDAPLWLR
ncbi:MAG: phenylalanine--tRNA ligase subunit alpha, partial [Candidatus Thorarchaeota archaeon]